MLLAHIVPLYAFIFQWIKSQFSLRFRKKIISRFLCPPSFPEEPFYFSSQETVQCAASVNLLSPEPLWLALGNTRELKLLSSSVSIIKLFFLKLIACSPGDPSHISGSSHSPKHTGYHCDLNRDCFCVKKKKVEVNVGMPSPSLMTWCEFCTLAKASPRYLSFPGV